jgi:hypothetical protein
VDEARAEREATISATQFFRVPGWPTFLLRPAADRRQKKKTTSVLIEKKQKAALVLKFLLFLLDAAEN